MRVTALSSRSRFVIWLPGVLLPLSLGSVACRAGHVSLATVVKLYRDLDFVIKSHDVLSLLR
jgi:hypothetical protein